MHHPIRTKALYALAAGALSCTAPPLSAAGAQAWSPERNIEIVVGSSPGSGTDITARMAQKIMQSRKLVGVPVTVMNRPGGGSAIALAHLHQQAGNAHYFALGSYNLVTNYITGKTKLSYLDFTPLAHLFNEYVSFNVRVDSPLRSGRDLVERVKRDPSSVTVGVSSSVGGANHVAYAAAMKAAGADISKLKVVVFNSGGETTAALMGGHVDMQMVSASVSSRLIAEGKIRSLGLASPQRLGGNLAQVPTWTEQGVRVVASNWRNAIGPGGLTPAQVAYWDAVFPKLMETPEWKQYLETGQSDNAYLNSDETRKYLAQESAAIAAILADLGLARQAPPAGPQ
jgi:putative tricarboxylic transport membrane protein